MLYINILMHLMLCGCEMGGFWFSFLVLGSSGSVHLYIAGSCIPSGPDYHAATSVDISCGTVVGMHEPAMYEWTSTCTGDCFVLGSTNATVTQPVLRSADSGSHTCSVTDAVGNTGEATINVNVFGK